MDALDIAVTLPGGKLDQIDIRFRAMEDSKSTKAIVVANQVFKDQVSVNMFLAYLPEESFRFCADMKVQLFDLQEKYLTVSDSLQETKADVIKANFKTVGATITSLSFEITHPEVVIR